MQVPRRACRKAQLACRPAESECLRRDYMQQAITTRPCSNCEPGELPRDRTESQACNPASSAEISKVKRRRLLIQGQVQFKDSVQPSFAVWNQEVRTFWPAHRSQPQPEIPLKGRVEQAKGAPFATPFSARRTFWLLYVYLITRQDMNKTGTSETVRMM